MKGSLRKQIIAAVLFSQALLAIGLTVAIVLYSRSHLRSAFNITLEGRTSAVLAAIRDVEEEPKGLILDQTRLNIPPSDLFEVWDDSGTLVWRSPNWSGVPAALINAKAPTFEFTQAHIPYRGIVMHEAVISDEDEEENARGPVRMVTVIYASSTRDLDNRTLKIGLFAAGASCLLLCLSGLFAAHGVSRGLAPILWLAKEAAGVSARNWNFSPPKEARTIKELAPLINALEATIAGLQRAFDRERDSTADAAHELKTAVAILKSSLQLVNCQPRSSEEYKRGLNHALEDCDRLEVLVCGMLGLARAQQLAEEGKSDSIQSTDLVNSCERSVAELETLAQSRGLKLRCITTNECIVRADPVDLQTVWSNLLQNSIQHSPRGSTVLMRVSASGADTALVLVEDSGEGISSEHLAHVFERFRRGDPSRARATGGFGLGLPICKSIVEAYGGRIEIESGDNKGTRVLVFLPVTARVPATK